MSLWDHVREVYDLDVPESVRSQMGETQLRELLNEIIARGSRQIVDPSDEDAKRLIQFYQISKKPSLEAWVNRELRMRLADLPGAEGAFETERLRRPHTTRSVTEFVQESGREFDPPAVEEAMAKFRGHLADLSGSGTYRDRVVEALGALYPNEQMALLTPPLGTLDTRDVQLQGKVAEELRGHIEEVGGQYVEKATALRNVSDRIREIDEQLANPPIGMHGEMAVRGLKDERWRLSDERRLLRSEVYERKQAVDNAEHIRQNLLGEGVGVDRHPYGGTAVQEGPNAPFEQIQRQFQIPRGQPRSGPLARLSNLSFYAEQGDKLAGEDLQTALGEQLERANRHTLQAQRNFVRLYGQGLYPLDEEEPGGLAIGPEGIPVRIGRIAGADEEVSRLRPIPFRDPMEGVAQRLQRPSLRLSGANIATESVLDQLRYKIIDQPMERPTRSLRALEAHSEVWRNQFLDDILRADRLKPELRANAAITQRMREAFTSAGADFEATSRVSDLRGGDRDMVRRMLGDYHRIDTSSFWRSPRDPRARAGLRRAIESNIEDVNPANIAEELIMGNLLGRPPGRSGSFKGAQGYTAQYERYLRRILDPQNPFQERIRDELVKAVPGLHDARNDSEISAALKGFARENRLPLSVGMLRTQYGAEYANLQREGLEIRDYTMPISEELTRNIVDPTTEASYARVLEHLSLQQDYERALRGEYSWERLARDVERHDAEFFEGPVSREWAGYGLAQAQDYFGFSDESSRDFLGRMGLEEGTNPFFGPRGKMVDDLRRLSEQQATVEMTMGDRAHRFRITDVAEGEEGTSARLEFMGGEPGRRHAAQSLYEEGLRAQGYSAEQINDLLTSMVEAGWTGDRFQFQFKSMVDLDPRMRTLLQLRERAHSTREMESLVQQYIPNPGTLINEERRKMLRGRAETVASEIVDQLNDPQNRRQEFRTTFGRFDLPSTDEPLPDYIEGVLQRRYLANVPDVRQAGLEQFGHYAMRPAETLSNMDVDMGYMGSIRRLEAAAQLPANRVAEQRHQLIVGGIQEFMNNEPIFRRGRLISPRRRKGTLMYGTNARDFMPRVPFVVRGPNGEQEVRYKTAMTAFDDVFSGVDDALQELGMSLEEVKQISGASSPLRNLFEGPAGKEVAALFPETREGSPLYMPLSPFTRVDVPELGDSMRLGDMLQLAYMQKAGKLPAEIGSTVRGLEGQGQFDWSQALARGMAEHVTRMRENKNVFNALPVELQRQLVRHIPTDDVNVPAHLREAYFNHIFTPALENMGIGVAGPTRREAITDITRVVTQKAPRVRFGELRDVVQKSNYLKYGAAVVAAIGAAGVIRAGLNWHKADRTEQDMNGPPGLPGGNPYDNTPPPNYSYGTLGGSPYAPGGGVTYSVDAHGDFDPSVLQQHAEGITGTRANGTIYSIPNYQQNNNRDARLDGMLRNF